MSSELDPRGYQVWSYADPTDEEGRRPLLWPFWRDLPPRGEMAVLDRSWYSRALTRLEEDQAAASGLVESINTFERQLGDDGYLILKFFLNISRREQKRRLEKLSDHGTGTGGGTGSMPPGRRSRSCCSRPPTPCMPPGM